MRELTSPCRCLYIRHMRSVEAKQSPILYTRADLSVSNLCRSLFSSTPLPSHHLQVASPSRSVNLSKKKGPYWPMNDMWMGGWRNGQQRNVCEENGRWPMSDLSGTRVRRRRRRVGGEGWGKEEGSMLTALSQPSTDPMEPRSAPTTTSSRNRATMIEVLLPNVEVRTRHSSIPKPRRQ